MWSMADACSFSLMANGVDSVSNEGTFAQPLHVNLDNLFFRWGARLNQDVVKDLSSNRIPMNVGNMGDKPNIQLVPWRFFPVINSFGPSGSQTPITRNLDAVWCRFASTLDTVASPGYSQNSAATHIAVYQNSESPGRYFV